MPIIDKLSGNKYFTTVAFANGYYKMPVAAENGHGDAFMNNLECMNLLKCALSLQIGKVYLTV